MNPEHEDLPTIDWPLFSNSLFAQDHGTASVGVLASCDNGLGTTGMVPQATVQFRSFVPYWPATGIYHAALSLTAGNVLLIEIQAPSYSTNGCYFCMTGSNCEDWVPVEYYPGEHAAIRSAVQSGIVVVEPSGNAQSMLNWT